MSMNDPIADLLTRIRNASSAGFPTVNIPASRLKADVCRVLKEEGFIREFEREEDGKQEAHRSLAGSEPAQHGPAADAEQEPATRELGPFMK